MKIRNAHLEVRLHENVLEVANRKTARTLRLSWPGTCLSIGGKIIRPTRPAGEPVVSRTTLSQVYEEGGFRFVAAISLGRHPWFRKRVSISSRRRTRTPDFVEVDRQSLPADGLRRCGYRASTPEGSLIARKSDEEGSGMMPGCGYPLIGRQFFLGLEHPAGFNCVEKNGRRDTVWLRHHPTWEGCSLGQVDSVFGWAEDGREAFADYLEAIRLPRLRKPLICFCTFWSDPYRGELEYVASYEGYKAFFEAFQRLGLAPDLFTLDAGWMDRRSVFEAKQEVGRDQGLVKLRRLAEKGGSGLSLWVSHNGPVAFDEDFMKGRGYALGGGKSAAYCGDGYGVMMDAAFSRALERRFCELVRRVGVKHLKIDWDNDCATNPTFAKVYPTRNHVRQASLDVFFRIARKMREINPQLVIRNGWWPSPWWLREANHFWLPESGDCEFAALPSKTQRDAATTHRDFMYYNVLQRDRTPVPLDCFDSHEFADAPRNPFVEDAASWVNAVWLSFLRGSTYLSYPLMPDSLEDWQVASLKAVMRFCRVHAEDSFSPGGRMILGNPGRGEVYGFLHPGKNESWCVLRNPLPLPQVIEFHAGEAASHEVRGVSQFYPHHERLAPDGPLTFLAHEVKVMILSGRREKAGAAAPHMIEKQGGQYLYRFPASMSVRGSVGPMVHPIQRVDGLECLEAVRTREGRGERYDWFLAVPYRMREVEVQFCVRGKGADAVRMRACLSRYQGSGRGYALPITKIPVGDAGCGEKKNLDGSCRADETYYAIRVADGGRFNVRLELAVAPGRAAVTSAWVAGHEAPSRNAVVKKRGPARFSRCLPCPHPLGFGQAIALPLSRTGSGRR